MFAVPDNNRRHQSQHNHIQPIRNRFSASKRTKPHPPSDRIPYMVRENRHKYHPWNRVHPFYTSKQTQQINDDWHQQYCGTMEIRSGHEMCCILREIIIYIDCTRYSNLILLLLTYKLEECAIMKWSTSIIEDRAAHNINSNKTTAKAFLLRLNRITMSQVMEPIALWMKLSMIARRTSLEAFMVKKSPKIATVNRDSMQKVNIIVCIVMNFVELEIRDT